MSTDNPFDDHDDDVSDTRPAPPAQPAGVSAEELADTMVHIVTRALALADKFVEPDIRVLAELYRDEIAAAIAASKGTT